MRGHSHIVGSVLFTLAFLSMISLPSSPRAGGAPAPIPVTFGPNINLSVEPYSQGVVQAETTIAVNPRNRKNMVEGNIDALPKSTQKNNSFSFTIDGGQTWTLGGVVPLEASDDLSIDPAIAADADGNFYYSYLELDSTLSHLDVVVAKSTDGGRTFPALSIVRHGTPNAPPFIFPDKDYIAVDTQDRSPFEGTIYVAWSEEEPDFSTFTLNEQIMVAVSRDGGVTWSAPIGASAVTTDPEFPQDALPVVAPDGTVFLFYEDINFSTGRTNILFSKSTDGGRSWAKPASVAANLLSPGLFLLKNSDPQFGTSTRFIGIDAGTNVAAAIAPDGTLFTVWVDFPNGSCFLDPAGNWACSNSDVRLSMSKDGGNTWSAPVKVSDDTGSTDQFNPWIAAHPNGLMSIFWLDKRLDPNNVNYDVFYTNTFDGASSLPNVRISTATSISGNGETWVGDYNVLATTAGSVVPVWSDMRSTNQDVYVSVGRLKP